VLVGPSEDVPDGQGLITLAGKPHWEFNRPFDEAYCGPALRWFRAHDAQTSQPVEAWPGRERRVQTLRDKAGLRASGARRNGEGILPPGPSYPRAPFRGLVEQRLGPPFTAGRRGRRGFLENSLAGEPLCQ
jgi:hypothetical protein